MKKLLLNIVFIFLMTQVTHADEILINIVGVDEKQGYDGKPVCELKYDITNNSTGTIYYISVNVDGWDDRDSKLDEVLNSSLDNGGGFGGRKPIAVGSTLNFEMDMGFKTTCKYMAKVKVTGIKPEYCNIRMLPENTSCEKIVKVTSSVSNIRVE